MPFFFKTSMYRSSGFLHRGSWTRRLMGTNLLLGHPAQLFMRQEAELFWCNALARVDTTRLPSVERSYRRWHPAFSLSVDWIQLRVPGHNITHKPRQVQSRRSDHRRNDRTAVFYRNLKYIFLSGLHPIPSWTYRVMCSASGYSLRLHVL